jgi:hypothetical protein
MLNKIHDLKSRIYFTTEKGTFDDRFVLFYTTKSSTTSKEEGVNKSVVVATTEKEIKINTLNSL